MNAISHITVLPSSKDELVDFTSQIIAEVEAGNLDPLTLSIRLKWIEKIKEVLDTKIKESVLKEAAKYGKSFERMGFKIEIGEAGTKYDYSKTGDIEWERLDQQAKSIAEAKKAREAMLKTLKTPIQLVNESTGECYEVHPPVKTSTTTLKFSAL